MTKLTPIDEYIDNTSEIARPNLIELRGLLREVAPDATENIKWNNPVFEDGRILFAFAAFKDHINFMPTPAALEPFKKDLESYKTGKGSIQLAYDKPLPKGLIRKIAIYRVKDVKQNDARWM